MDYLEKRWNRFLEKSHKKYGGIYIYNKNDFKDSDTKIDIYCTKHNLHFHQTPKSHLQSYGCKECSKEHAHIHQRFNTTDEFIRAMIEEFGVGTFTYEKTKYVNMKTDVIVTCPKHGDITKSPDALLNQHKGCWKCGRETTAIKKTSTLDEFISKSKAKFGDKYDYSVSKYVKAIIPIDIICPIHGKFSITPHEHLVSKTGCPECSREQQTDNAKLTPEQIIELGRERFGDKYTYLTDTYKSYQEPMEIICPRHGKFLQSLDNHLHSNECKKCSNRKSTGEKKIFELLCQLLGDNKVYRNYIGLFDDKREVDVYVPFLNLAIEFNGLRWHSNKNKNYHLNKTKDALDKGVNLIHIFEDEWIQHEKLVLEKIASFVYKSSGVRIGARKCQIREINKDVATMFLNEYHIQNYAYSSIRLGAYYNEKLVAVMTFKKENNTGDFELNRFASDYHYILPGIASKLFTYFIKNYDFNEIKSFLDRRWVHNNNNIYTTLGFKLTSISKPDYRYVIGNKRIHKFNCRKNILHKKYGFPLTMTEQEMVEKLGYRKIWDCGLIKYTFYKKN